MKKILLSLSLVLAACFSVSAQDMYELYTDYQSHGRRDDTADIFKCKFDMCMGVSYTNMSLNNRVPGIMTQLNVNHGFSYYSDIVIPIWGPIGINLRWLDLMCGFGRWNTNPMMPWTTETGCFSFFISDGISVLPQLEFHFGRNFALAVYGGVKGGIAFVDGINEYPIVSGNEKKRPSVGHLFYGNYLAGVHLRLSRVIGLNFTYEWGWSRRLKDAFYNPETVTELYNKYNKGAWASPQEYNPRYDSFSVGLVFWFDL